ncbi:MAG: TonB-dependent receptor [Vulcanimicrobiaceae bacterium]
MLPEIGRVTTSDRRVEPVGQTSRPTFVVTRARIEAYGARTVSEALRGVPGVQQFSYGPFGSLVDYGIRGSASAQTLVLVDGIPVTDPTTGTTFLGQLSTVGVERIEIVESGSSTLYGTNAAGGVINVITRVPRGAYLEASAGSFADRDLRVAVGDGRIGGSFERHVATSTYAYPELAYAKTPCNAFAVGPCVFPAGVRTNSYGDQTVGRLSADLPLPRGWRVRARADDTFTATGIPGRLDFLAPDASQSYGMKSALLELERTTRANAITLSIGGSQTLSRYNDLTNNFGESDIYSGRAQASLRDAYSGAHGDVVAGIDLSRESGRYEFPTAPDFAAPTAPPVPAFGIGASRSLAAAYVQLGVNPSAATRLTAGLRAENDSPFGSVLAPSFGGTIRSGAVRLAGNIGESFRVPTLTDQYYPGASNPNVRPEKSSNADATLAFETPTATYSLGYFGRSGSNFIIFDPVKFIPVNARRAQTTGLAFTATSRSIVGLVAEASYTNLFRAVDVTTGARLPRSPVGQAAISVEHPFARDRYAFGVRWGIVGSDGDDASNVAKLTGSYDAYDSLDAFVRYRVANDAVLSLRGFNLGDTRYAPIFGYPAPGRRLYVELATR